MNELLVLLVIDAGLSTALVVTLGLLVVTLAAATGPLLASLAALALGLVGGALHERER